MLNNCDTVIKNFLKSSNGEFVLYYNYDKINLNNVTGLFDQMKCKMNSTNFDCLKNNVHNFSSKIYYNDYHFKNRGTYNCVSLIHLTNVKKIVEKI